MSTEQTDFGPGSEKVINGFNPFPTEIYLDKQPNLTLFSKPKIIPIKSPNLLMIEKLENNAMAQETEIQVPDVFTLN